MSFVSGLSYRLGTDMIAYSKEYYLYKSLFDIDDVFYFFSIHNREPLWVFISSFFRTFGLPFFIFHLFQVCVVNFAVCRIFKERTECKFISILVYLILIFTQFNYEIMRESFSVSIFLFSYNYLLKSQYLKYYLFSTIAIGFHISAIILFFLPIVKLLPKGLLGGVLVLACCILLLVLGDIFKMQMLSILDVDFLSEKASGYFSSDRYSSSKWNISYLLNLSFYLVLPMLIYCYYYKKRNFQKIDIFCIVSAYMFVYTCTIIFPIFYRINNYFIIFFIVYIVEIYSIKLYTKYIYNIFLNCAGILLLLLFLGFKFYNVYLQPMAESSELSYRRYYPYSSIFTQDTDNVRERIYN